MKIKLNDIKNIQKTLSKENNKDSIKSLGDKIGVDWKNIDIKEFKMGLKVESEHGSKNKLTNVTNDDSEMTAKIALAHLMEYPDYYTRLEKMEEEAKEFWKNKKKK